MAAPLSPPPGFDQLSAEEKVAYVQALWDLISARPEDVTVPDWHKGVIAERLEEARSASASVRTWAEVRADIQARVRAARR